MRQSALALTLVFGLISSALADKPGCDFEAKPLHLSYPADLPGLEEETGEPGVKGAGEIFFEKSAEGSIKSRVNVTLDKVDRAALKPRECLIDLVTVAVFSQVDGDPAPVIALAEPAAAETMKKFATPAMMKATKESMLGASEISLLLVIESEGVYACLYSVKFAETTTVFPLMFQKGEQGYSLSDIPSLPQRIKLMNLQEALGQLVMKGRADALIIR